MVLSRLEIRDLSALGLAFRREDELIGASRRRSTYR